jgi:hypothetical protein
MKRRSVLTADKGGFDRFNLGLATALLLLLADPGKAQSAATPATDNSVIQPAALLTQRWPKTLKASWRGSTPGDPVPIGIVEWDGKGVRYTLSQRGSAATVKSEQRFIIPTDAAWQEFWRSMDDLTVWQWRANYRGQSNNSREQAWTVEIEWGARKLKASGTNSFPGLGDVAKPTDSPAMFNRFRYALDLLLARPIEVSGTYLAGFETSRLTPSGADYMNQRWWLTPNADFNERYQKLLLKDREKPALAGPEVSTRVRGRLAGPGQFGHLNQYPFEFLVEQVVDMKALPKAER